MYEQSVQMNVDSIQTKIMIVWGLFDVAEMNYYGIVDCCNYPQG